MEKEEPGLGSLVLCAFAVGVHFVVTVFGLREDHKGAYERAGRWVLATVAFTGWAVGLLFEVSEVALAVPFAFLDGGVVMNVLKEELPGERESRFWVFVLGAGLYAAVLLVAFCWWRSAGGVLGSLSCVT